ncbi:MAG: hypothetical protein O7E52_29645 [Candidatus Poribacteria bacterium]|nr:hypothetical protein [Candidatus Poribacteria bacterium]
MKINPPFREAFNMTGYDVEKKLVTYREACRKGADWLLNFMNPDGSIGPVQDRLYYYRVPWALARIGEVTAASRVLDWIRHHMFSPAGAFEGMSPQGTFADRYGSYPLACLIVGATLLQRYDIVYRGAQRLLTWQDSESGGFHKNRQDMTATSEQELFPACQGGMTLLLVGQVDAAKKAGEWLKRLWALQPDVAHKLYAVYSPAVGLVTEYPSDQAALYVTRKDEPWQHHFNGGIAAAFLTQLYIATSEKDWLDLARKYQDFSMTTDECQFQSMQTCKSGWGSGLLYVATRERCYRDWTVRLGDWFVAHQFGDGHWENTKFWTPNPSVADKIEITAEFVMHVTNIIDYLSV